MSSLHVYCEDIENNPHCVHGPTLLFSRQVKGKERKFYACSACRDRKDCEFFMWEDEKNVKSKISYWQNKELELISNFNHKQTSTQLYRFKLLPIKNRKFCQTCYSFVFPSDKLHIGHLIKEKVSNELLECPTLLLKPIQSNAKEAQFWFTQNSKQFIINTLKAAGVRSCLSLGTPTIHEVLRQTDIKSVLFDLDNRYQYFYNENEFCWFNMFNCHFMANKENCQRVLLNCVNISPVGIVIDPPFGARMEPLAHTVSLLKKQARSVFYICLILPYFMEPKVLKYFPNLVMLDYQIQYSNHKKFQVKQGSLKTSPVRIFTNIPPSIIKMPASEGYYYCKKCDVWRYKNNQHCTLCNVCPSKNGEFYTHCNLCLKCVKKTWFHCSSCDHCVVPGHKCLPRNTDKNVKLKKVTHDPLILSKKRKKMI